MYKKCVTLLLKRKKMIKKSISMSTLWLNQVIAIKLAGQPESLVGPTWVQLALPEYLDWLGNVVLRMETYPKVHC